MLLSTPVLTLALASFASAKPITPRAVKLTQRQEDSISMLDQTNYYRSLHSADSLIWNDTLAEYAAQAAATCDFEHSGESYGENLAAGDGDFSDINAVDLWYDENQYYDYSDPGFSSETGHFTQLVWKATSEVGCARQYCDSLSGTSLEGAYFIVCEYYEAGNVVGGSYFEDNVTEN